MSDADTWRRFALEVFNEGKVDLIDEIVSADYVDRDEPLPGIPPNRDGFKMLVPVFRTAFPDLHCEIIRQLQDGDVHVGHMTVEGTMQGDFAGMPATGKHAKWEEIHIGRFKNGKLVEHWSVQDQLGMMQQLGLAPAPGA